MQKQLMNHVCILTILKIYIYKTNMVTLSKYMTKLTVLEGKTSFFKTKIVNFAISSLDKAQHISEPMITRLTTEMCNTAIKRDFSQC